MSARTSLHNQIVARAKRSEVKRPSKRELILAGWRLWARARWPRALGHLTEWPPLWPMRPLPKPRRASQPAPRMIDDGIFKRWYRGDELAHVEAVSVENATRICRRTMQPWEILTHARTGKQYEAVSWPFADNGAPRIMVRSEIGEPCSLVSMECSELRPIQFTPRLTGVPANDPLPDAIEQLKRRSS